MSIQSPSIVLSARTPAEHYNWVSAFCAALDALGVTQTADTGQVVLSGITALPLPTQINAANSGNYFTSPAIFQIRKLAAAGMPTIYIRFDFGIYCNNNGSGDNLLYAYPTVSVSIGSATNGAGGLISFQTNGLVPSFMSSSSGGWRFTGSLALNSYQPSPIAQQCDFASDGQNYLTIMLGENAPAFESQSVYDIGIERTIDPSTGLYNAHGMVAFCGHTGGSANWMYADAVNSVQWEANGGLPALAPPFNIGGDVNTVDLFPFVGSTKVPEGAPTIGLSYYGASISSPVSFPADLYSTPHTYKACPRSTTSADPYATGTKLALRFD